MLLLCWKGVHCLSAAWHLGSVHDRLHVNKQSQRRRSRAQSHNFALQAKRKLSLSATRQPFMVKIALSLFLLFVKLACLCVFSSFIWLITYERASREHAFNASGSAKPEPQQRRKWEGAKVRQMNPSPQTLRSPKIRESLVVTPRSTARSSRSTSSYGRVLAASSRVLAARPEPVYFFVQTFVDFALSLPGHSLWVCLHPRPWIFFLRNDKYGQEMKISSKCPNSVIASPHVKYVKGW